MDISDWRKRIDEIDGQLAELLSERSRCVIEIGKIKRQQQLPVYDPQTGEGNFRTPRAQQSRAAGKRSTATVV